MDLYSKETKNPTTKPIVLNVYRQGIIGEVVKMKQVLELVLDVDPRKHSEHVLTLLSLEIHQSLHPMSSILKSM